MDYKIISDSGCDLTSDLKKELDVEVVPLSMTLGDDTYIDDEALDVNSFIEKMQIYKGQAKSACPSPNDFINKCKRDATTFIVTLSSKLSGSFNSAKIAKDMLKDQGVDAHVFDSKSAAAGQLLIVRKIRELINSGIGKIEIIQRIEDFIKKTKTFFVLENLDNMVKNGRMSKITGIIAGVLNIRLVLRGDSNGEIALHSKARGAQQSILRLAETIGETCTDTKDRILAITHCNNLKQVNRLIDIVKDKYSFKEIIVAQTKGLTSMYANEGGIVIAF
ncbi:MAG: DegV family protein [Eubacteriales bacterium]